MNERRVWIGAILLFVFGDALTLQTRGALLPSFQSAFGVSEGLLGLVAPAGTVGFVAAVLAIGFAAGRIDAKLALLAGVVLTGTFLLLVSGAWAYLPFLLFMAAQGTATGMVRAIDRPILGHLFPERRGQVFTWHALAWAVGAVSGPLVVNAVLATADWRLTYVLLGVFFLILAVVFWRLELPGVDREERSLSFPDLARLIRRPPILGMALALLFAGGIEGVVFTWLPFYATPATGRELANVLLSVFLLAYLPGRLFYSVIADRLRLLDLLVGLSVGALPAVYLAFSGVAGWLLFGSVFVAGLFVSGFFPLAAAFGVYAAPEYSGPVNAIAVAGTYAGIALGPVVVGVLAERTDIGTAMTLPIVLAAGLLVVMAATRLTVGRGEGARSS